eukprot:Awhi_evm1s12702
MVQSPYIPIKRNDAAFEVGIDIDSIPPPSSHSPPKSFENLPSPPDYPVPSLLSTQPQQAMSRKNSKGFLPVLPARPARLSGSPTRSPTTIVKKESSSQVSKLGTTCQSVASPKENTAEHYSRQGIDIPTPPKPVRSATFSQSRNVTVNAIPATPPRNIIDGSDTLNNIYSNNNYKKNSKSCGNISRITDNAKFANENRAKDFSECTSGLSGHNSVKATAIDSNQKSITTVDDNNFLHQRSKTLRVGGIENDSIKPVISSPHSPNNQLLKQQSQTAHETTSLYSPVKPRQRSASAHNSPTLPRLEISKTPSTPQAGYMNQSGTPNSLAHTARRLKMLSMSATSQTENHSDQSNNATPVKKFDFIESGLQDEALWYADAEPISNLASVDSHTPKRTRTWAGLRSRAAHRVSPIIATSNRKRSDSSNNVRSVSTGSINIPIATSVDSNNAAMNLHHSGDFLNVIPRKVKNRSRNLSDNNSNINECNSDDDRISYKKHGEEEGGSQSDSGMGCFGLKLRSRKKIVASDDNLANH